MEGEQTSLPCPIDMYSREPLSAVWFQLSAVDSRKSNAPNGTKKEPRKVYALEAPVSSQRVLAGSATLVDGSHWKQPRWKHRAFFSLLSEPPALRLNRLERADTGNYVCNVTYRDDNASIVTVTEARFALFVAVPQEPPVLADSRGVISNSMAGPYGEGDIVRLTCAVPATDHKVTLAWQRDGVPLDSPLGTVSTPGGRRMTVLTLGPLRREHLLANISCLATSDVSMPAESWALLDMYLSPTKVALWSWPYDERMASGWFMVAPAMATTTSSSRPSSPLSTRPVDAADSNGLEASVPLSTRNSQENLIPDFYAPRSFECAVTGSRPHANVTWLLDGSPLGEHLSTTRIDGNVTTSVLLLPPLKHAGKLLECRATNDRLQHGRAILSRYLAVNISDKPEVNLKLGAGLNASHITEGTDVYMECSVLAASKVGEVTWRHQGRELESAPAEGMLITSRYLVIRRVTPSHAGSYTCRISKTGEEYVESAPFHLRLQYSPRCDPDAEQTIQLERNATVNLTCNVRANPRDGLRYFWLIENASEVAKPVKQELPTADKKHVPIPQATKSNRLEIIANASIFNAALACWSENSVGIQRRRCRFKFVPLGEASSSGLMCVVGNYTDTSFSLVCSAPIGENQTTSRQYRRVLVEVFDSEKRNHSERSFWSADWSAPMFVTGLRPSTDYLVVVRMTPESSFRTYVRTLSPAQTLKEIEDTKRTAQHDQWSPALQIVLITCALASVSVAFLGICIVHAYKKRWKSRRAARQGSAPLPGNVDSNYIRDQTSYTTTAEHC
ncbi:hemicentin-1-like isoform X2 [Dermacentor albipictus]